MTNIDDKIIALLKADIPRVTRRLAKEKGLPISDPSVRRRVEKSTAQVIAKIEKRKLIHKIFSPGESLSLDSSYFDAAAKEESVRLLSEWFGADHVADMVKDGESPGSVKGFDEPSWDETLWTSSDFITEDDKERLGDLIDKGPDGAEAAGRLWAAIVIGALMSELKTSSRSMSVNEMSKFDEINWENDDE